MREFTLIDETFSINNTENYELSIQFFLNGFSFCIFDNIKQKFILLEKYNFDENSELLNQIDEIEYFNYKYHKTKIIIESNKTTLLPEGFFSPENIKKTYDFNFPTEENITILHNKLKTANAYNIFSIENNLLETINKKFINNKIYNQNSPFIESNLINNKNKLSTPKVFVNINHNFFDILVIDKNEIILHNSFEYKETEDFIYYVMFIYEQLKLNPDNVDIEISGIIDYKSEKLKTLKKYIKKVNIPKRPKDYTYSYTFNQINQQEFYNLFNLNICE